MILKLPWIHSWMKGLMITVLLHSFTSISYGQIIGGDVEDIEEEKIKDTKEFAKADRDKKVNITNAEMWAEQALVKEIKAAENPDQTREEYVTAYKEKFLKPYPAAASGHVDEVLIPSETRPKLIAALELLKNKQGSTRPKKHGNMTV